MGDFALDETALPMANAYNKQIEDQVCLFCNHFSQ